MSLLERDQELALLDELMACAHGGEGRMALRIGASRASARPRCCLRRASARAPKCAALRAVGGELDRDLPFGLVRQLFESTVRGGVGDDVLPGAAGLAAPVFTLGDERDAVAALGDVVHGLYWLCAESGRGGPSAAHRRRYPLVRRCFLAVPVPPDAPHRRASHPGAGGRAYRRRAGRSGRPRVRWSRRGRRPPDPVEPGRGQHGWSANALGQMRTTPSAPRARWPPEGTRSCSPRHSTPSRVTTSLRWQTEADRVARLRPLTITRSVLSRIARLGGESVRLAHAMAILGANVHLQVLADFAGLSPAAAIASADALASRVDRRDGSASRVRSPADP